MIQFGILGAAAITPRALIYPLADEPGAFVRAIAARDRSRAQKVADWAGIPDVVADYQAVIDHPKCNAIYIPLPITAHHEWTLKALNAGKHVLCEKSLAANGDEAEEMAALAENKGLVLMEAFHYRYHPVFKRAKEIVRSGAIGKVTEIDANFSIPGPMPATDIRMQYETGGGATMDLGCYPISWVRHLMDDEPRDVTAVAEEGPKDVDVKLSSVMTFDNGVVARANSAMQGGVFDMSLTVTGDGGSMRVNNPLAPQSGHSIEVTVGGKTSTETRDRRATYGYQLDAFIAAVERGEPLLTDGRDGVRQMRLIDRCYTAAGMCLRGLKR